MATQTSNLGLTKPAYSETADIADINNNMDKVDAAVHGVQNGMAILANGNVHSAVTSGQYVYVRNHGTLAEGLYTATTNISTNATLSTSNLTAVPNNGALNTLRDDVTSLNSNIAPVEVTLSGARNVTINEQRCYKTGKLLYVFAHFTVDATISQYGALLTLPSWMVTASDAITPIFSQYGELRTNSPSSVYADDDAATIRTFGEMPAGVYKINTVLMLR